MPTVTPIEVEALRAVRDHRWYPTQTIAEALEVDLAVARSVLQQLKLFGLVEGSGARSRYLGEKRWGLTSAGEKVLAERLPALARRLTAIAVTTHGNGAAA